MTPDVARGEGLAEIIEQAFDYRGDVTVTTRDGGRQVGYLFNRRRDVAGPFIQIFPAAGGDPLTIAYADIDSIAFTGQDMASGRSYEAWLKRKQSGHQGHSPSTEPSSLDA